MIPKGTVEEAVTTILKTDRSHCECPVDGHSFNPPCETRIRVTEQVQLTLKIADTHLRRASEIQASKPQWAIFGVSSPVDAEPIIRPRFSSKEDALAYIKEHFLSPQFLQVRSRTVTGWAA
jgi:hypothetical protein